MMYKRQRISPPNPESLEELQLDDDNIKTFSNRNSLLYDSGPGASRILMFATKENLDFLSMSSIWLANGTLKQYLLYFANYILSTVSLEDPIHLKMVICYHVFTLYSQTKLQQHTRRCGILSVEQVQIQNHTICSWTLNKQQLILSMGFGL